MFGYKVLLVIDWYLCVCQCVRVCVCACICVVMLGVSDLNYVCLLAEVMEKIKEGYESDVVAPSPRNSELKLVLTLLSVLLFLLP